MSLWPNSLPIEWRPAFDQQLPLRHVSEGAWRGLWHVSACQRRRLSLASWRNFVTNYRSSADSGRAFCSVCGSKMPVLFAGADDEAGEVIIPAGTLDDDLGLKPIMHIFTASKAPWFEITDEIVQFEGFPSDEWMSQYE
jgi:hypothetical protein